MGLVPHRTDVLAHPRLAADRAASACRRASGWSPTSTPASPATRWSSLPTCRRCPRSSAPTATPPPRWGSGTCRRRRDNHDGGDRHSWPLQRGFDRFYGFLEGFTSFHHPHRLVNGNDTITVDEYPPGYYLTDDLTDRAIEYVRGVDANAPGKPFFLYFAHAAVHAPLQAKADHIAAQRGRYEQGLGRRARRALRSPARARCRPAERRLPDRPAEAGADVRPWADADRRRTVARRAHAGGVRGDGHQRRRERRPVARCVRRARSARQHDRRVHVRQRRARARARNSAPRSTSAPSSPHSSVTRRRRCSTTSRRSTSWVARRRCRTTRADGAWCRARRGGLFKQHTFAGGHTVPFIIAGPGVSADEAGAVRFQYQHATDLLPTLVELAGVRDARVARVWR